MSRLHQFVKHVVKSEWEWVRQNIFPTWDRKKEWTIQYRPRKKRPKKGELVSLAKCFRAHKTIHIKNDHLLEMRSTIIHEICHASALGHRRRWQDRMMWAAKRAEKIGLQTLADEIKKDVEHYQTFNPCSNWTNAQVYYADIEYRVVVNPAYSYSRVLNCMARLYRQKASELEREFSRGKYFYEKTHRTLKRFEKRRQLLNKAAPDGTGTRNFISPAQRPETSTV